MRWLIVQNIKSTYTCLVRMVIYPSKGVYGYIPFNGCIIFTTSLKPLKNEGLHVFLLFNQVLNKK